ncbi:hypothetical protein GTO89_12315 [Heliobacterium gestii]|uniref:4Fe-4S ferredoxin-type domain-containing protein n=1 Tax=Heliomicrobium gestii TaxID=2699 RepID=A0A845LAY7_HELGE|nr:hypothetical protein [Heliomicrobium gestii]MBM7867266.1 ferredoxin [Heliomicrobium gestii]MZP43822.1 hypothetical protein [Heliomicrobium gestii]
MSRRSIRFRGVIKNGAAIEFFGTMIPSLLLFKRDPHAWWKRWRARQGRNRQPLPSLDRLLNRPDDTGRVGETHIFIFKWQSDVFDLDAFHDSHDFLLDLERVLRAQGRRYRLYTSLSPKTNLPELAAAAGLGDLSPFGLLIHRRFGPRMLIVGVEVEGGLPIHQPEHNGVGCTDCGLCLRLCPQAPEASGEVDLRKCEGCGRCITCCPVGKSAAT